MSKPETAHSTPIRIRETEKSRILNEIISTIQTQLRTQSKVFRVEMILSESEREYINGRLYRQHNIATQFITDRTHTLTYLTATKEAYKQNRDIKRRPKN